MNVPRALSTVACLLLPATGIAGGTVGLDHVDPLLRESPAVRRFLASSLDIDATVVAASRLGRHFTRLGGTRIGPYVLRARLKGSTGPRTVEVVLCTSVRFLDESGNVAESEVNAVRVEERLAVILLRDVNSPPAMPACPE